MDVDGITAYLKAKHACNAVVRPVYTDLAFRRLRWQGFRATQRADANVVKRFTAAFGGPDTTAICWGDWAEHGREGSTHMKFHEPTRGIGLCRLFAKAGFHVWKVDENYTSKRCHGCQVGDCAPFRLVKNPRPFARAALARPKVTRWGLTRCNECGRLWDRDVNSAQNILWAATSHLVHGTGRPAPLTREWAQAHH